MQTYHNTHKIIKYILVTKNEIQKSMSVISTVFDLYRKYMKINIVIFVMLVMSIISNFFCFYLTKSFFSCLGFVFRFNRIAASVALR